MSASWAEIMREVAERADHRCEYCQMHQSLQGATFHTEHIVPRSRGGSSDSVNLALSCPGCNFSKSDRLSAIDPQTGGEVALFHPRRDEWNEHFVWDGRQLSGLTEIGRALIAAFDLNSPRRQRIREAEEVFDLFPP